MRPAKPSDSGGTMTPTMVVAIYLRFRFVVFLAVFFALFRLAAGRAGFLVLAFFLALALTFGFDFGFTFVLALTFGLALPAVVLGFLVRTVGRDVSMDAWAAASLAMGTRKGLQET